METTPKLRILFVDDEEPVLRGIRRMLHGSRRDWAMAFAGGGREALEYLAKEPVDVVVSDMKMPEMNGAELLKAVKKSYPHVTRIILSGYCDQDLILDSVGAAHQYLVKPCDPEDLKQTIQRADGLNRLHGETRFKALIASIEHLPPMPELYLEISHELQSVDPRLDRLIAFARTDPALTARTLQLVNSGFFGLPQKIVDVSEAIQILGARVLKSLVLLGGLSMSCNTPATTQFVEKIANHSLAVAELATALAPTLDLSPQESSEVYTAGVLHDIGKMIFAAHFGDRYLKFEDLAKAKGVHVSVIERQLLKTDHGKLGSYLLRLWGLPDSLAECVSAHSHPDGFPGAANRPLVALHVADSMHRVTRPDPRFTRADFDQRLIEDLDLTAKIPAWQAIFDRLSRRSQITA